MRDHKLMTVHIASTKYENTFIQKGKQDCVFIFCVEIRANINLSFPKCSFRIIAFRAKNTICKLNNFVKMIFEMWKNSFKNLFLIDTKYRILCYIRNN